MEVSRLRKSEKKTARNKNLSVAWLAFQLGQKKTVLKLAAGFRLLDPPFGRQISAPPRPVFGGFLGPQFQTLGGFKLVDFLKAD